MKRKSGPLLAAMAGALVLQGYIQQERIMPFWREHYDERITDFSKLTPDHLLASLAGFRELIAGILWVQASSYFDEGNYDAVLPLTRVVTMLNPRDTDPYVTGTWHMAYNFTDEESRSDRRYLPSALAFIKEGAGKNPDTYELAYETAWTWYHKIDDDYGQAVKWMERSMTKEDVKLTPMRRNLLTNMYLRNGQVDQALEYWGELYGDALKNAEGNDTFTAKNNVDTVEQNLDAHLIRMAQRGHFARKGGYFDQGEYDTKTPYDVKFGIKISIVSERVLQAEGNWGVQTLGTRLRIILKDDNFPHSVPGGADWDKGTAVELTPPKGQTFMQDQLFVRDMRFSKKVDMSRNPTMYPFTRPKYIIEVYYNPRSAPNHIQDQFGWNGEGMTDKNYLNNDVREGQRVIFARFEVDRDQILRRGEWARNTPVFMSKGYTERNAADLRNKVIQIPGFGEGPGPDGGGGIQEVTQEGGPELKVPPVRR